MSPPNHDEAIQQLVADFRNGYLTRRGFLAQTAAFGLTAAASIFSRRVLRFLLFFS